jgi:probable HAF family extracellular repeat protein
MQDLGTLGGGYSFANGVSADGSVVVGQAWNAAGYGRAFRWTASGGMQSLGTLPGGCCSAAYDVSADGSVVVGGSYNAAWQGRAFRWTAAGGMQNLGTLGGSESEAYGVSADGSVVVGWAQNAAGQRRAFRWTAGGMQDLGTPPGYDRSSEAFGVSADGSVVVGWAQNAAGFYRAFRWTAAGGMEDLNTTYASLLTNGSVLWQARAISPDGRYIVGAGYNAATGRPWEAFLLDTQPSCTAHNGDVDANGCVDDADLLAVLFAFGNTGSNLGRVDVNCDGTVDDADLLQVLFNFGSGC